MSKTKSFFLLSNLLKGLLWFIVIIVIFIVSQNYLQQYAEPYIASLYHHWPLFYGLFVVSELVFGVIPPEFFMMVYIVNDISAFQFAVNLLLLFFISYLAGIIDYFVGRILRQFAFFDTIRYRLLNKYQERLMQYGGYLVLVGAVTPLPFSAMCLLVGTTHFPLRSFLWVASARVLRFITYGWFLWEAHKWF